MRKPRRSLAVSAVLAAALAAAATAAPQADEGARPQVEPRADTVLRAMSQRLAELPRFAFEAEETFDDLTDDGLRVQLTNLRRIAVERPGRVAADSDGDTLHRAAWLDRGQATVLDKAHNAYARAEVAPTIDGALDDIAERFGIEPPLEDFLFSDPYEVLTEGVLYGRYLGLHQAGGVPCHHLAFVQATIEWQIWVDAGADPLPRKFVITYVREPGEPQYSATFRKWNLEPVFPEGLFHFEPPPGAQRAELPPLGPPNEAAAEGGAR